MEKTAVQGTLGQLPRSPPRCSLLPAASQKSAVKSGKKIITAISPRKCMPVRKGCHISPLLQWQNPRVLYSPYASGNKHPSFRAGQNQAQCALFLTTATSKRKEQLSDLPFICPGPPRCHDSTHLNRRVKSSSPIHLSHLAALGLPFNRRAGREIFSLGLVFGALC